MSFNNLKEYAPVILRVSVSFVFLWFGLSQILNPSGWTRMIPEYVSFLASPLTLVYINGVFEVLLALLLVMGYKIRIVSGLLFLHLLHIVTVVGYGPTGARDFALSLATLSIFFNGIDNLSLDSFLMKRKG